MFLKHHFWLHVENKMSGTRLKAGRLGYCDKEGER